MTDWAPASAHENWLSDVVARNKELRKCILDCGPLRVNGVALSLGGETVYVQIESTVCEHCATNVGPCALPDFGVGTAAYRDFVLRQPREECPVCHKKLQRRLVLRLLG